MWCEINGLFKKWDGLAIALMGVNCGIKAFDSGNIIMLSYRFILSFVESNNKNTFGTHKFVQSNRNLKL